MRARESGKVHGPTGVAEVEGAGLEKNTYRESKTHDIRVGKESSENLIGKIADTTSIVLGAASESAKIAGKVQYLMQRQ